MSQQLTHWREFFKSDYFAACDLAPGEERVLTISAAGEKEVPVPNSSKKDLCLVIEFMERDTKPMVLNVTNSKAIAKITGSPHIEKWLGRRIAVYQSTTRFKGEEVDCLRIRPKEPPLRLPDLTPQSPRWASAVEKFAKGEIDIPGIRKHCSLSDSNAALLREEAENA